MPSSANQSVYYILVMGSTPTVHDVDGRVIGVSLNISDAVLTTEFDGVVKEGMLANGVFLYSSQCNGTGASGSPVEYAAFADSSVLNYITIDNAADFYYGFIKGQDIGWTHADTAVDLNSAYIPILPNCNLLGHLADAYDILTAGYYEVHSFWVNGTHRVEFTDGTGVKYILVFDGTSITARYSVTPAIVEAPSDNTSS